MNRYTLLTVVAVVVAAACGSSSNEPAPSLTATGTGEIGVQLPDGGFIDAGWVDPCTLVNGRNHTDVTFVAVEIDNSDPKCAEPRYQTKGTVSMGSLPIDNNMLGGCPITYTQSSRLAPDGGYEPACRTTASCMVQFNGGPAVISYDLLWNVHGKLQGWSDQTSGGQLCPYVKATLDNWGGL